VNATREFFNAFLNLNEIKNYLKLFLEILPSPTKKTMYIVEHGHSVNPFRFMAFGYSVYSLMLVSEPLISGKFSFADSIVQMLLGLILYFVFAVVQYKILKDVSSTPRTFDNYLVMSAIVGGMFYLFLGIAAIGILFDEAVGGLLLLGAMIYLIPYGLKTSKRFWEISYGKIFLYSFLSSIAATIAILCFVVLLYVVFDIEPVINGGETQNDKNISKKVTENISKKVTEINGSVKVSWFLGGYQYVGILNMFGIYGTMRTTYFNPTTYMNEVVDQDMHLQSYQNEMFLVGSNPKVGGTNIPALYSPDTFRLKRLPDGSLTISYMCDQNGVCALVQVEVLR